MGIDKVCRLLPSSNKMHYMKHVFFNFIITFTKELLKTFIRSIFIPLLDGGKMSWHVIFNMYVHIWPGYGISKFLLYGPTKCRHVTRSL